MDKGKDDKAKRRKVGVACVYCRRSHMTCDQGRPCKRCIKRDIGHLCHDESPSKLNHSHDATRRSVNAPTQTRNVEAPVQAVASSSKINSISNNSSNNNSVNSKVAPVSAISTSANTASSTVPTAFFGRGVGSSATLLAPKKSPSPNLTLSFDNSSQNAFNTMAWGNSALGGAGFLGLGGAGFLNVDGDATASGDAAGGNEFNILSEFLESLDGNLVPTPGANGSTYPGNGSASYEGDLSSFSQTGITAGGDANDPVEAVPSTILGSRNATSPWHLPTLTDPASTSAVTSTRASRRTSMSDNANMSGSNAAGLSSKAEKFFLTAADQKDGTRDERLGRVIQAKLDAGLLRPYNHVNGYARLNKWMEQNASQESRRRILKPLSIFRPAFRAVAQSLTNVDLIYIEEAFERLLLDYDRVFSTQGIPACLWRRTGEIYKGNKEFAELVGVGTEALRDGRCTIYEFMQEESAVNYWEKYGAVSFDPGQKAVLTSCILKTKVASGDKKQTNGGASSRFQQHTRDDFVSCCFSFTIRRDAWSIPCLIVGNFLPLK